VLVEPCIHSHSRFPVVMFDQGDDLRLRRCWIYRCGGLTYLTGIVYFFSHLLTREFSFANDNVIYTAVARNCQHQHSARPYITGEVGGLAFNI
jgi:hypothetical protein